MSPSPSRRTALLVLAGYLLLSALVSGGMLLHAGSRTLTANPHDVALLSWFLDHDQVALGGGHGLLITRDLNAPDGVNLLWNTSLLLPGVVLAPLTWLAGGLVTFTVLLWLGPALSAWAAYLALGRLVRPVAPRAVGGLVFGFSPALLAESLGHLQVSLAFLVPVLLLLVLDLCVPARAPRSVRRTGVLLGVLSAAQLLIGEEVFFGTALTGLLLVVALAVCRPREVPAAARAFGVGAAWAAGAFAVLAAYPLAVQLHGRQRVHGSPFTFDYFKVDLASLVVPGRNQLLAPHGATVYADRFLGGLPEQTGFLGLPLLGLVLLMAVLCWRDLRVRVPLLLAGVVTVLALGGTLAYAGRATGHRLPWRLVQRLPLVEGALPTRFMVFTALLLGVAVAGFLTLRPRGVWPALVLVALVPMVPRPFLTEPVPPVPAFFTGRGVTVVPAGSTALVVPFPTATQTDPMRWQAAADMRFRMPGGFFIGPDGDGRAFISPLLAPTTALLEGVERTGAVPPLTGEQRQAFRADLAFWQARTVLLGPSDHHDALLATLTGLLGRPPDVDRGGVLGWTRVSP